MSAGSNSPRGHGPQPGTGRHPALGLRHLSPCHQGSSLLTLVLATHSRCLPPTCPDQTLWPPPAPAPHRPLLPPPPASRPARRRLRAAPATALPHLLRSPLPTSRSLLPARSRPSSQPSRAQPCSAPPPGPAAPRASRASCPAPHGHRNGQPGAALPGTCPPKRGPLHVPTHARVTSRHKLAGTRSTQPWRYAMVRSRRSSSERPRVHPHPHRPGSSQTSLQGTEREKHC